LYLYKLLAILIDRHLCIKVSDPHLKAEACHSAAANRERTM
jgi:hypothetical protein